MAQPTCQIVKASNMKPRCRPPRRCLIEQKLSGHRILVKKGFAYGRSPDSIGVWRNKWDKLPPHIQNIALDEWLDGELIWPGHDDSELVTGWNEHPAELKYIAFALPEQYETLYPHQHLDSIASKGIAVPVTHEFPERPRYRDVWEDLKVELNEKAKACGLEGWVAKEELKYPIWWKLKVTRTYDLIMTGWNISTRGKHKGQCKSIQGSVLGEQGEYIEIANVSGMNDEIRYGVTDSDIGRVFEVEANLLAGQGRLRHPRFLRWRDDKVATECTYGTQIGEQTE